ncbi:MAG: glutamate-cysteine ligase family protein [Planctomycetia bacterium]
MGEHHIADTSGEAGEIRAFSKRLLRDLRALERMLKEERFEKGVRRIGAEQEVFLVDRHMRPAPTALEVLKILDDPQHYTTEVARFNLEMNTDPLVFGGSCLSQMEQQLDRLVGRARMAAATLGNEVVLTGILPTIRKSDLGLDNMTPIPRYFALNRAMTRLRGEDYAIALKGVDELYLRHDSVMVESCNASFQAHFQVAPHEFAKFYNIAQVAASYVLACATNSPMLMGRRLWNETRIALFQQSVDTRAAGSSMREAMPRVDFGREWVRQGVVELYEEGIARFRILIAAEAEQDPFEVLDQGGIPELKALRLHNGTIYRWNRACYGVMGGLPHLRIELRPLPSGPTVVDEVANLAFWYGLVAGLEAQVGDITRHMSFDEARQNFFAAARSGLGASLAWLDGETLPAPQLLLGTLLPLARKGLVDRGLDAADAKRYLDIIEERVSSGRTGSRWMLSSFAGMAHQGTLPERLAALTAATVSRQVAGQPVARWEPARLEEGGGWRANYLRVEQMMATDFVTVREDDALEMVANLMVYERERHVPVEDAAGRLVGLVSYRALLRQLAGGQALLGGEESTPVSHVMKREPLTIAPDASTLDAIRLMRTRGVGCLPVVKDGRLVGMVTARALMGIVANLLEEKTSDLAREEAPLAAADALVRGTPPRPPALP